VINTSLLFYRVEINNKVQDKVKYFLYFIIYSNLYFFKFYFAFERVFSAAWAVTTYANINKLITAFCLVFYCRKSGGQLC